MRTDWLGTLLAGLAGFAIVAGVIAFIFALDDSREVVYENGCLVVKEPGLWSDRTIETITCEVGK